MTCKHNGALNPRATALCLALLLSTTAVIAADTPVYPDGNKIEGVWDSRLTYRSCETGVALFTGQSLLAYAHGGVLTTITTGAAPSGRYPGLGVWRHVAGHQYQATFKEFRYNADGSFAGKIIVVLDITHEPDDTLTTRAVGRFYDAAGTVSGMICPTGVSVRFTGES